MQLTCKPYPGNLDSVGTQVARALTGLGEADDIAGTLTIHGPFPLYIADPKQYARGATRRATTQTGWRALISSGGRALASVNLSPLNNEETSVHVRGKESAEALQRALETGLKWLEENNVSAELRFLTFPSLFITVVWLHGRSPRFIPTRIATKRQLNPSVLTRTELMRRVAQVRNGPAKAR